MILSGKEIQKQQGKGLLIEPFNEEQINPNSYDLRLHNEILVYETEPLDMKKDNPTVRIAMGEAGMILYPNRIYLARTIEYTETPGFVPQINGKSSIGRLGITTHITAGFGDIGFKGHWTLELSVTQPVRVYPNVRICQIYYLPVSGDYDLYNGRYLGQRGESARASRFHLDFGGE